MFAVYDRPVEFPAHVVVREVLLEQGHGRFQFTGAWRAFVALEEAREHLRELGLECVFRQATDDLTLVESWI